MKFLYIFLSLLNIAQFSLFGDDDKSRVIKIPLQRLKQDPWKRNDTESFCFSPLKINSNYTHNYSINMPINCTGSKELIKIQNECVYQTVSYQANFTFDSSSNTPFRLALDLRTPWSWLKSPVCRKFSREGVQQDYQCNYLLDQSEKKWYNQTYNCEQSSCKRINDRCGEIDLIQEGLSVIGEFVSTKIYFKDKSFKKPIKNWQILWAHGLSGQSFLEADGVFGLGLQHINNDEENENSYFEQGTDLWGAIKRQFKKINPFVFGLYLAEHETLKNQILIGQQAVNQTQFMHLPDKFKIKYIQVPPLVYSDDEEYARIYFQWKVPLKQIVFRFDPVKETQKDKKEVIIGYNNRKEIIFTTPTEAQLSLQTSALILPGQIIEEIINNLKEIYKIDCSLSKKYINFVSCYQMQNPLTTEDLYVTIHLSEDVILYMNSNDLILGCKKVKGLYDCQLNIQLSYDDKVILGDSAFRNNYMVFDIEGRRIGFCPARSVYNDKTLWTEFLDILVQVEDIIQQDIIFLIRFFVLVILSAIVLFCFVNGKKVYKILLRKFRYKNIIDPSETAFQTTNMSIRRINSDDHNVIEQIQELEQDERLDAL